MNPLQSLLLIAALLVSATTSTADPATDAAAKWPAEQRRLLFSRDLDPVRNPDRVETFAFEDSTRRVACGRRPRYLWPPTCPESLRRSPNGRRCPRRPAKSSRASSWIRRLTSPGYPRASSRPAWAFAFTRRIGRWTSSSVPDARANRGRRAPVCGLGLRAAERERPCPAR
jgi:hypothetical protein